MEDLDCTFKEIEQLFVAPHESQNTIDIVDVVRTLFRVAFEYGDLSGNCDEENHVHLQVGNDTPRVYAIPKGAFRELLAAIANRARLQCHFLPENKKFSFYGDDQIITYEANSSIERFQVETSNDNRRRPFYFVIRYIETQ